MRMRLFVSTVLVVLYSVFRSFYTPAVHAVVEAQLAPLQAGDDSIQYGLSRVLTIADFVSAFVLLLLVSTLIFMWLVYYLNHSQPKVKPSKLDHLFRHVFDSI
ncbi:MAG: hypothetical protein IAF02_11640 [Anaerolineae bacterium]|nr:hypothetical protein [Anaerolineae bacterium]